MKKILAFFILACLAFTLHAAPKPARFKTDFITVRAAAIKLDNFHLTGLSTEQITALPAIQQTAIRAAALNFESVWGHFMVTYYPGGFNEQDFARRMKKFFSLECNAVCAAQYGRCNVLNPLYPARFICDTQLSQCLARCGS